MVPKWAFRNDFKEVRKVIWQVLCIKGNARERAELFERMTFSGLPTHPFAL